MTIFTKPFRKNLRSSINSGQKGRLVLQKSKRRSRMVRVANLASKKSSIEVSLSPLSSQSSVPSTAMSSLTQESTRYKKHGVTFNEFIEGNGLDWRKFGCITYDEMKSSGYYDLLMKRIMDYSKARSNKAKHQLVLSSSELPLTDTSSMNLHSKIIAVNSLLLQIGENPSGSIVDMSNSVEKVVICHSAEQIRRWALQFIHNGGVQESFIQEETTGWYNM